MMSGRGTRVIVVTVGTFITVFGVWAFAAPSSFYESVATFPPYNRHFLHDIGAFQVGLGASLLLTLLWRDGLLVVIVGNALAAVLHLVSHVVDRSLGGNPATDFPSLAILAVALVVVALTRLRPSSP